MKYRAICFADGKLRLLDQTLLPNEVVYVEHTTVQGVYDAIRSMQVRGAPAIGIAAAYGMSLTDFSGSQKWPDVLGALTASFGLLMSARPTAASLEWAVQRMLDRAKDEVAHREFDPSHMRDALVREANRLYDQDAQACQMIGTFGAPLIKQWGQVLTYCNAGALAATELGTALAPIYTAARNRQFNVYCCETRPHFQGSRLTAWELTQAGLSPFLLCDNAAAVVIKERADLVIVGADRIAANGDVANKIGTYGLAVLAKHHDVPFYVAAPFNTFDFELKDGGAIPIETRHPDETTVVNGKCVAPKDCIVVNPAFDITPHELITGIITERGIISPVNEEEIERWMAF